MPVDGDFTPGLPLSFELFPPRTTKGHDNLTETVERLAAVATGGFSVTMGAGGSSTQGTVETSRQVAELSGRPVMAHLVAMGQSRSEVLDTADRLWADGITALLALRGDTPKSGGTQRPDGFAHAVDLVSALKARHDFTIAVAAYPEKHPEAESLEEDIDFLKAKLDAGATEAFCQFVLDPAAYARFLDACGKRGISAPIIPGLMPLDNWPRVRAFAQANGTTVPEALDHLFAQLEYPGETHSLAAMALLMEHARQFVSYGAPALHIYTLNRWQMPLALALALGQTRAP